MNLQDKATNLLTEVRRQVPLVHCITNYVTVNDCANALLAIGGSPIMADDEKEAADITKIASALVLNLGTLNSRTIESMILSGREANRQGIPVILDPVGAGASKLRNETTKRILKEVKVTILRGNLSEISFLSGASVSTKGVDVSEADQSLDAVVTAKKVARQYQCVVAITGAVDVISDGERVVKISNGHKMLSRVTGTGCMTSAILGAYAGVNFLQGRSEYLEAAVVGVASMGIAGEIAYERAGQYGTGSFHVAIIDALSQMEQEGMKERALWNEER